MKIIYHNNFEKQRNASVDLFKILNSKFIIINISRTS